MVERASEYLRRRGGVAAGRPAALARVASLEAYQGGNFI